MVEEDPAPFENELEPSLIDVEPVPDDETGVGGENLFEHEMAPSHVSRVPPPSFQFAKDKPARNEGYPPRWAGDEFEDGEEPPLGPMATFIERKRGTFAKNSVLRLLDCDWTPCIVNVASSKKCG